MKIEKLQLKNFQQYGEESVQFNNGVSIIHGDNGAGKTTILRGIFGGLFQSALTTEIPVSVSLNDLVRNDKDYAKVELSFIVQESKYHITWELERYEESSVRTKSCVLTVPKNNIEINGVTDVSRFVEELLNIDAKSFVNSVYVQQTDLSRLITASAKERKQIFDQLLGLENIDKYIENTKKARREVKRERKSVVSKKQEVESQLSEYDGEDMLEKELHNIEQDVTQKSNRIEDIEEKISNIETDITELEKNTSDKSLEELKNERQELNDQLTELTEEIEEKITTKEELDKKIEESNTQLKDTKQKILFGADLRGTNTHSEIVNQITEIESSISVISKKIKNNRESIKDLDNKLINDLDTRHRKTNNIHELTQQIESLRMCLVSERDIPMQEVETDFELSENESLSELAFDYISRYNTLRQKSSAEHIRDIALEELFKNHNQELQNEMIALFELSTCELSSKERTLSQEEKTLVEVNIDAQKRVSEYNSWVQNKLEKMVNQKDDLNKEIKRLNESITTNEQKLQDEKTKLQELTSKIASKFAELKRHNQAEKLISEEIDNNKQREQLKNKVENLEERLSTVQERIGLRKKEKIEVRDKLNGVDDDIKNSSEEVQNELSNLKSKKSRFEAQKENINETMISLNQEKNDIKNELERVQLLLTREAELSNKIERLTTIETEMNKLIEIYEDVKTDARSDSIALINKYTNQIFNELYENSTYVKVIIHDDYTIKLQNSDGSMITPKMASGGEGALINIALRAGVYRTIAEIQGMSQLPPFILDEPTTFLDEKHVNKLTQLINKLNDWEVPQVIIVSHNQSLIDKADTIYKVTKDSRTDESKVSMNNV